MKIDEVYRLWKEVAEAWCWWSVHYVKWYCELACKILNNNNFWSLEEEYKVWKLLQNNNVSVPDFKWIAMVKKSLKSYHGLIMDYIPDGVLIKRNIPVGWMGRTIRNTTSHDYKRGTQLLLEQIDKIESLDLPISDKGIWNFDWQWLYNRQRDQIYLMDFGEINLDN